LVPRKQLAGQCRSPRRKSFQLSAFSCQLILLQPRLTAQHERLKAES
jgi:hypothetical protein